MNYWMLGADWDGDDQTQDFIDQGIWQNGYTNKFLDTVKRVKVGDKVAIKTVYVQKNGLPFNNYGCDVSCMKIKTLGEVLENLGDGRTLKVKWEPLAQERKIYLYTYWHTIMRVAKSHVKENIFDEQPQNFSELEKIYKQRAGIVEDQLSDEQILNHFKFVKNYKEIEKNNEYKLLFLEFVRFMHRVPLDWWIIYNDTNHQIRFGENKSYKGRKSTNRILGFLEFSQEGLFLTSNQDDFFSTQERVQLNRESFEELKKGDIVGVDQEREPYIGYFPNDYEDTRMNEKSINNAPKLSQELNRILFGAAGTGKTFHTINHALSIIENKTLESLEIEKRDELKKRFDEYKGQGQIKFVTFHQSFSYEDFVEGIRAETDEQGALSYDVKSGVFKEICERANFQKFSEIDIDKVVDDFAEEISKNEKLLETKTGIEFTVFNSSGKGGISVRTTTQNEIVISKKAIKAYLLEPSENIRRNQAYAWAVARYLQSKLDEMTSVSKGNPQDYVLIIDEINRGNISRIFGELITLIEDSKRQDADEALSVTLPYSKEEFSVPDNVYIIGTMNSSDRSLTGLDIALRRRFTFVEMPPRPELLNGVMVDGLDLGQLLKLINQRIEVLLDRDHCIGHASFMSLKDKPTLENLSEIFRQKIIPQLQEYFFDDWNKINLVLFQNGMVTEDSEINISSLFPADAQLETDYSERKKVWRINDDAFKTIDAFKKILGLKE